MNENVCCSVASCIARLPLLELISLDSAPFDCINSGDWQRAGLGDPPSRDISCCRWVDALMHLRQYPFWRRLLCSRCHHVSSVRLQARVHQLHIYAAPDASDAAAAAIYVPKLTRAQLQLLMCTSGHACHFVRVMMPRDVRHNMDPHMPLLLRLLDDSVAIRLSRLCGER